MLFMGTSKYPDENEYSQVINNHGGSQNGPSSEAPHWGGRTAPACARSVVHCVGGDH